MSDLVLAFSSSIVTGNPAQIYIASLGSKNSRRVILNDLNNIAKIVSSGQFDAFSFPWQQITYQVSAGIRAVLSEKYAPASANRILSSLKGVLRECRRLGLMGADECAKACDIKPIKGERPLAGRAMDKSEVKALMDSVSTDPTNRGVRDAAILALMRVTGMRRSEVVKLDVSDIDLTAKTALVREGKGNKTRVCQLGSAVIPRLASWIELRGRAESQCTALFTPVSKADRILDKRLTDQAIASILSNRLQQAGIAAKTTPHDIRRGYATDLLEAGVDIETVSKMMGHSSVVTTQRYSRRGEEAQKAAVESLGL